MKQVIKSVATSHFIYSLLVSLTKNKPRIIMYHGVSPYDYITPERFEQHLMQFKKYFQIVKLSQLSNQHTPEVNRPLLSLTFDDGLKNNYDYVVPLLEKHGVPATFFVCSGLLDGQSFLWNHELRIRLLALTQEKRAEALMSSLPVKDGEIKAKIEELKKSSMKDAIACLGRVRDMTGDYVFTEKDKAQALLMGEGDIRNLPEKLVEIGSHTRTHPILEQVERDQLDDEIIGSKLELEKLLDKKVTTFCYPNGSLNKDVSELVSGSYELAVTTESRLVQKGDEKHHLPRVFALTDPQQMLFSLLLPMV